MVSLRWYLGCLDGVASWKGRGLSASNEQLGVEVPLSWVMSGLEPTSAVT